MRKFKYLPRMAASASLLALAACGGGGGGGISAMTTPIVTTPALPVQAAAPATLAGNMALTATGATPTIRTLPVGTVLPLQQSALAITPTTAAPATAADNGGVTLTFTGNQSVNGDPLPAFELKVPGLGIDAVLPADATATTTGSGQMVSGQIMGGLTYTMPFLWEMTPASSTTNYIGLGVTGYQTPASAVPASGQATYALIPNNPQFLQGFIFGIMTFMSNGSVVQGAILGNKASVTVNFATGAVAGTMTLSAGATGFTGGPWNTVSLSGNLSGAAIAGTTAVTTAPLGDLTFDMSSTGVFNGALFGPNGQELGAVWSLHDPTGTGKTALGTIAAVKTN